MRNIIKIVLSLWISFVFIQSLFFKFAGHQNTDYIFETIATWAGESFSWFGVYGGYIIGSAELVAAILLLSGAFFAKAFLQKLHGLGALMSIGIMTGAIFFHLGTPLGVVVDQFDTSGIKTNDDGGTLFIMACTVWLSALALLVIDYRNKNGLLQAVLPAKQV